MESAPFAEMDKTQIPPLNQNRILTFVNSFLINTCTFLNEFTLSCEAKFIELERKLQRTEAALIILEAKLASIPTDPEGDVAVPSQPAQIPVSAPQDPKANANIVACETESLPVESKPTGVRVCEDIRYKKYFKMVQVGVPAAAVKLKMQSEGLEPSLLDNPESIVEDGVIEDAGI
ncbi:WASH complex subunit 3 [Scaptodrosophila lebanonensis]|uniref:WASH complex subunit 3 n=1 Tax=Drosophila lebanonensis TaxID=7225 RepID=A0A6J2U608_DROLE|nr:WASH complex subunit 3 [Scaptodrosophila lebanonensis]